MPTKQADLNTGLPPGAKFVNGQLVRVVTIPGTSRKTYRAVALSLEEAKAHNADFFSVVHDSWIRGGRKVEKENILPATNIGLAGTRNPLGLDLPDPNEEED